MCVPKCVVAQVTCLAFRCTSHGRHHVVVAFTMSVCRNTEAARLVGSTNQTKVERVRETSFTHMLNPKHLVTDCLSDGHHTPHHTPHCTYFAGRSTPGP